MKIPGYEQSPQAEEPVQHPEEKPQRTYNRVDLYQTGFRNGLSAETMDQYPDNHELAKLIGTKIENRQKNSDSEKLKDKVRDILHSQMKRDGHTKPIQPSGNRVDMKLHTVTEDQISGLDETERAALEGKFTKLPSIQRNWKGDPKIYKQYPNFGLDKYEENQLTSRLKHQSEPTTPGIPPVPDENIRDREPMTERQAERIFLGKTQEEREAENLFRAQESKPEKQPTANHDLLMRAGRKLYLDLDLPERFAELDAMDDAELKTLLLTYYGNDAEYVQALSDAEKLSDDDVKILGLELNRSHGSASLEKEKKEGGRRKLFASELSDYIDAYARQEAKRQWQKLYEKSGFFRRVQLHLGENYYVDVKLYNEIRENIEKNKTLTTLLKTRIAGKDVEIGRTDDESYRLLDAILEAYENDLGLKENEKAKKVEDEKFDSGLSVIIVQAVKHDWDRKQFNEELNLLLGSTYRSQNAKASIHEGHVFAFSDIYQYVEQYKSQIKDLVEKYGPEAGEHINGLMGVDLYLGKIDADIRKDPRKAAWIDKLPAGLQSSRVFGLIANPAVFGSATAMIGRGFAKGKLSKALTTATAAAMLPTTASLWVPMVAAAAVGGLYTGLRRNKEISEDWNSELKEQAMGRVAGGARNEKIRKFMLDMEDANVSAQKLSAITNADDASKRLVAEIYARLDIENAGGQEMFRASEKNADLSSRRADMNKLYLALRQLEGKPGFARTDLAALIDEQTKSFRTEMKSRETALRDFRAGQNLRAAVQGALTSIAGSIITQEAIYWGKEGLNLLGSNFTPGDTLAHMGGRKLITGEWHKHFLGPLSHENVISFSHGVEVHLDSPEGFGIEPNSDGTINYLYHGEHIADHLALAQDGHGLSDTAKKILTDKGFHIHESAARTVISQTTAHEIVRGQMPQATLENLKQKYADANWGVHHRLDWHHQGPQESSFFNKIIEHPGKEQMEYLNFDANGHVVVDAHKIVENFAQNLRDDNKDLFINPDGSVDAKMRGLYKQLFEWQQKGELGKHIHAVVLPDKHSSLSAVFVGNADGKITLSESLSKLVNPDHLADGKLPYTIELRLDDGHVLATASGGNGMFEQSVSEITKHVPHTLEIYDTSIIPPVSGYMNPFLATPMAKRYPLKTASVGGGRTVAAEPILVPSQSSEIEIPQAESETAATKDLGETLHAEPIKSGVRIVDEAPLRAAEPEQIDLPEDMHIQPTEHIERGKDKKRKIFLRGERIKSNSGTIYEAIIDALKVLPHIRTKANLEKLLTAQFRILASKDGYDSTKQNFGNYLKRDYGLEPDDFKVSRSKDHFYVKLDAKAELVPLLRTFQANKDVQEKLYYEFKNMQSDVKEHKLPRFRVNLLENMIRKMSGRSTNEDEDGKPKP